MWVMLEPRSSLRATLRSMECRRKGRTGMWVSQRGQVGLKFKMYFGSFLAVWLWTSRLALGFSYIFKTGIKIVLPPKCALRRKKKRNCM